MEREHERLEKLALREGKAKAREDTLHLADYNSRTAPPPKEFRNFGEFIYTVAYNKSDPRLRDLYHVYSVAFRAQTMGTGSEGGFNVPEQFRPELLAVPPQGAVIRPRARVIPAGDPPDAKLSMPALDQTVAGNMYGGVTVAAVAEAGAKTETSALFREVSLEPGEVAGWIRVSDKLLRNWGAASVTLSTLLRQAMTGWEDYRFLRGTGMVEPLGVINSPAAIQVSRQTANQVTWQDVRTMYSRAKFGGSLVWIASQTTLPFLMNIADGGSNNLFVTAFAGAAGAVPGTLFGLPLLFADRSPALGSTGDLVLADLQYYLVKDGSGPFVDASPHVYFTSDQTVIRITWNVDGKPWLTAPLQLEGSSSNTVSPFVVLQ
jgi:HK97 family phage major capsid protein